MSFADNIKNSTNKLITKFGNVATLTLVESQGYDVSIGKNITTEISIATTSVPKKDVSELLSDKNYNVSGFGNESQVIPYQDGYSIDEKWLFNGNKINKIEQIKFQDTIIGYILNISVK